MPKRVLVTGHLGYIGVHLVHQLKEAGHHVTGCDLNLFEECTCASFTAADVDWSCDFRTLTAHDLVGYDCVMHLAAISNDPMGELDVRITHAVNVDGTVGLAKAAKQAQVPLFLFASSCSIYGQGADMELDENAITAPLTAYAASKIEAEKALQGLSDSHFQVGLLRNATAYGFSPKLRIDLVVNNLLASALACGEIRVMSDGTPWRPLIHCQDIAKAFLIWMECPPKERCLALNIGCNEANYQVHDIVQRIQMRIPQMKPVFTGEIGVDPRNYRVSFDRLGISLPHFSCSHDLDSGLDELLWQYKVMNFSAEHFVSDRFVRLRVLKRCMAKLMDEPD